MQETPNINMKKRHLHCKQLKCPEFRKSGFDLFSLSDSYLTHIYSFVNFLGAEEKRRQSKGRGKKSQINKKEIFF